MKKTAAVAALALGILLPGKSEAIQRDSVPIIQICVESETTIWFTTSGTGNDNLRHYVRLASVGASRFDKIYAMLLAAKVNNRTIHYDDAGSNSFTGWLIID